MLPRLVLAAIAVLTAGCAPNAPTPATPSGSPPFEPEEALATLAAAEGLRVELFAAEPLVADPVALEIDEYGRAWVAEMPGYPLDPGGSGRIRLLEDTDGDGLPDASTIFADGLRLPTGLMRWKSGLLVTDAPDVLFLEDTDGDGRADRREVVLTGFALSNPQHNVNSPLYGLDNGIYLANEGVVGTTRFAELFGDQGSEVRFPARPDAPALGRNGEHRNVRFRPDTGELEALASRSQFNHTFDAWGRYFTVNNAHPAFHEVIAARYLARNPRLAIRYATEYLPAYGEAGAVYPITRNPEHQLLTDRGVFTSAAGLTAYLADLLPEAYHGAFFVAEPVHNLVHADRVTPAGATFSTDRILENREVLASTDAWFRPVNFTVGPDGALYVVDYYRKIVEHPEWMDDDLAESDDLYAGSDRGRIYRLVPDDAPAPDWLGVLDLGGTSDVVLVEALARPNIWWRRTAQRLLVDRRPNEAVALLEAMATTGDRPEGRVHALWTLEGMEMLAPEIITEALDDPVAGVRENAVRLAERRLAAQPALVEAVAGLADDPDPRVRFQVLATLGEAPEATAEARRALLLRDLDDPWTQVAALAVPPEHAPLDLSDALARFADRETTGRRAYLDRLAGLVGATGTPEEVARLIGEIGEAEGVWWQGAVLAGLADGLERNAEAHTAARAASRPLVSRVLDAEPPVRAAVLDLLDVAGRPEDAAVTERAAAVATDASAAPDRRADAVRLLALADADAHAATFRALIDPAMPPAVQEAAVQALRDVQGTAPATFLLDAWTRLTPDLRAAAVDVFLVSPERAALLLDAVEEGTVQIATIGWGRRVRLMRDFDGPVRDQARRLLSEPEGRRAEVIARYAAALEMDGHAERGAAVFAGTCSPCHRRGETEGGAFGPDLATVRHWPRHALMEKILDPARSVADGYAFWTIERRGGTTMAGIIAEETPTSITVRQQGGEETVIARDAIASIRAAGVSAMPVGLEAQITPEAMADLLSFLTQAGR